MLRIMPIFILWLYSSNVSSKVETVLTDELDGSSVIYYYSGGNGYHLKLNNGQLRYRYLTGSRPLKWWGPFSYKALVTENNEYLVSWYEIGYGDYITLLIDLENKILYGSGIIPGKNTHFEKAVIKEYKSLDVQK